MKTSQDQQAIEDGLKDYEDDQDDYCGMNGVVLFYFDDEYWLP